MAAQARMRSHRASGHVHGILVESEANAAYPDPPQPNNRFQEAMGGCVPQVLDTRDVMRGGAAQGVDLSGAAPAVVSFRPPAEPPPRGDRSPTSPGGLDVADERRKRPATA